MVYDTLANRNRTVGISIISILKLLLLVYLCTTWSEKLEAIPLYPPFRTRRRAAVFFRSFRYVYVVNIRNCARHSSSTL